MIENDILLDGFTRVYESLHRTLKDLTETELIEEPHPPIGWLAWRLTRVMDSNVSQLTGRNQFLAITHATSTRREKSLCR